MRVAVIGLGATGSAAARFLARAGQEVVGFEQFRIGHDRGSSHGESRIIRYTYPDPLYTEMMGDAYPLWNALEEEAGEELFVRCGGVFFGPRDHPDLRAAEAVLRAGGHRCALLDGVAARDRFPTLRLHPGEAALFQDDMGFLRATRCVLANARGGREAGAVLREETPVADVRAHGSGGVLVRTEAGEEHAFDRAIVTAGPWMGKLLARLDLPLRVTRQQIVYLRPRPGAEARFAPERFPVWIDAATLNYGFPRDGRIEGVKMAAHVPGETTDPDASRPAVDESYIRAMSDYAAARFPDLSGEVTCAGTCLYTNTPDEDFVLDRVPDAPDILLVSGCSGHGFKFTVLLGKIAADWAVGETYKRDLGRFSLRRFRAIQ